MTGFGKPNECPTFPELLAAYADEELEPACRARVEAWLRSNPDARESLATQVRLSRHNRELWRALASPSPPEGTWAGLFGRVHDALDAPTPVGIRIRSRRWQVLIPAAATAVAVLISVFLALPNHGRSPAASDNPADAGDVLAVAAAADVEILSLDGGDSGVLVVGVPPLPGNVVLAAVDDVKLKHVQKDTDGMVPKVQMNDTAVAPMIVAPVAGR